MSVVRYSLDAPLSTHFRSATCAEVDCPHHVNGWRTDIDVSTQLGRRQAAYIRHEAGRAYAEERIGDAIVRFTFPPGQRCFGSHRVRLDRDPRYLIGSRAVRSTQWTNEFTEHQAKLKEMIDRG